MSPYCEKCDKMYTDVDYEWCKLCRINNFKTNWTSGSEKIDDSIKKKQIKINSPWNKVFEWIPYDQFNDIKEIGKSSFSTVYSAIWKDGPLNYDNKEYARESSKKVALKYSYDNSQNVNKFLNEV